MLLQFGTGHCKYICLLITVVVWCGKVAQPNPRIIWCAACTGGQYDALACCLEEEGCKDKRMPHLSWCAEVLQHCVVYIKVGAVMEKHRVRLCTNCIIGRHTPLYIN